MIISKEQSETFREAAKPLMKYLEENFHPHVTAIVNGNRSELLEGIAIAKNNDLCDEHKQELKPTDKVLLINFFHYLDSQNSKQGLPNLNFDSIEDFIKNQQS